MFNSFTSSLRSLQLATSLLAVAVPCTILTTAPDIAYADAPSQHAGVTIPKGAQTLDSVTPQFTSILRSLAKEDAISLQPSQQEAEVFLWKGENFQESRIGFTKSAVVRALEAAGYTVKEIDSNDIRDTNIFSAFDSNNGDYPWQPDVWAARPAYFVAQNVAKSRTLLGTWLGGDKSLALGLLPVEFKAPRVKAPLPAPLAGAFLVKDIKDASKGLTPPKTPAFSALTRKPGTVRGWVKDGSGKPVVGAKITVQSSAAGGFRTSFHAKTNAQGLYEVALPMGIAEVVEATCTRAYNGKTYTLPLYPVAKETTQFNAKQGHVENFVLRTSGLYGGVIMVNDNMPDDATIEITLKPQGNLIDGIAGRTLVFRYVPTPSHQSFLGGIPLGRYTLTARLLDDGDAMPIRVRSAIGSSEDTAPNLQVNFEPGYTYSEQIQNESRTSHFAVILEQ